MSRADNTAVRVRDVTRADLDALAALRPPRELHAERVCRDIDDDAKRYVLATLGDGGDDGDGGDGARPVGFGVIYFRGDPMWKRPEQVPLVMDLFVAPPLRRRGIGRRIVGFLEDAARARGFACVYLQVRAARNPAVVRMYERLGYQKLQPRPYKDVYAEVDEAGRLREGEELILDMQKWL